jgi:hypothetical protein
LIGAILACKNSGFNVGDHFPDVRKTIQMPKTAEKQSAVFVLIIPIEVSLIAWDYG